MQALCKTAESPPEQLAVFPIINELVLKLASRCNINCTYCYWFNDPEVMQSPKMLTPEAEKAFIPKLKQHIERHQVEKFRIAFHGGEPTLFPKKRFKVLCLAIRKVANETGCKISFAMQSNGLLIDDEWIELLKQFDVRLGISLDGSQQLHDKLRIDAKGRGTYLKTIQAIEHIRSTGLEVYILSVASEQTEPKALLKHFVEQLNLKDFEVLLPHIHHQNEPATFGHYLCEMFDLYLEEFIEAGVSIRILDDLMCQVIGGKSMSQGYGYVATATLLTDGALECVDDLRMIDGLKAGNINIKTHQLQEVTCDPLWQEIYTSSIHLSPQCNDCEFKRSCGGGPMVSRWSEKKRFDNPSVYCKDYQKIIQHIQKRIMPRVTQLQQTKESQLC